MHDNEDTYLNPDAEIGGTHRVGELMASAKYLIEALGEPHHGASGDGKVTMEWWFETPAGVATLYDYKWYAAETPDLVEQWSIGGFDARVVPYVKNYIRECREAL